MLHRVLSLAAIAALAFAADGDQKVAERMAFYHVPGVPGYAAGEEVHRMVQILDGKKPANTAPIRVDVAPGKLWRYSGGGYEVMQQLAMDVTGRPFPQLAREIVLGPLHMTRSTFE